MKNITIHNYIFLSQDGATYAPIDDGISVEIENLQVFDFISAPSPYEAFLELKRNNPNLKDLGFCDVFCYELNKDYLINRKDFTL